MNVRYFTFVVSHVLNDTVPLKPSCFTLRKIPRTAHRVYYCVVCGSQNMQQLFTHTARSCRIYDADSVCRAADTESLHITGVNITLFG
jgi:hypothetical protein